MNDDSCDLTGLGITLIGIQKAQIFLKENGFDLPIIEISEFKGLNIKAQYSELIAYKGSVVRVEELITNNCDLSTVQIVRFRNELSNVWVCSDGDSIVINPENSRINQNLRKFMIGPDGNINTFLNIVRFGIINPTDYEKAFFLLFPKAKFY